MKSSGSSTTAPASEPELARAITAPLLFFYVLGDVLGSGIYALVGAMAGTVGGAFWLSFAVGVGAAMLTGFAYAELITKYPQAAGAALYVSRAFGRRLLTFLVTFSTVAATLAAAGTLALSLGGYFTELLGGVRLPLLLVAAAFVALFAWITFRGIRESVRVNLTMSVIELSGLAFVLLIGVAVLVGGDSDLSRPFRFNEGSNPALLVLAGAALAFFAMTGFENAANVAEEVRDPGRVYPRALLGGMATAGAIYLVIAFVASVVVPTPRLAGSEVALLEVVRTGLPAFPAPVFAAVACVAIANTCLVALVTSPRILYGMANEGTLPRAFARTHPERRTPWVATLFVTAVVLLLVVTVGEAGVTTLANATVVFVLTNFALVCGCALKLRRDRVLHTHFTAPAALLALGVVVNVALLAYVLVGDLRDLLGGALEPRQSVVVVCLAMLAVGTALYAVNRWAGRRRG